MKKYLFLSMLAAVLSNVALAQTDAINIKSTGLLIDYEGNGNSAMDGTALLQLNQDNTATKGFLVPRVNSTADVTGGTPATGLLVYQTGGTAGFYYYDGTAWRLIANTGNLPTTLKWNALTAPDGNLSLTHANYTTSFTFNGLTGANVNAFSLTSSSTAGTASSASTVLNIARSGANTNASHTAYGIQSAVTNTGTTNTNVAGLFSASGATNNYAIVVPSTGGNVGVGLTNPAAKMVISSNGNNLTGTAMSNTFRTLAGSLGTSATNEINLASIGYTSSNQSALGIRAYRSANGTDWQTSAILLEMDIDNTSRVNNAYISINANGAIGIGTVPTVNTYKLNVSGGKLLTAGIDENSDIRLKKDINPIYDALTKVNLMRGVTYHWRNEEFPERNFEEDLQFGLIAQELEKIIPELVTTDGDGYKAIEYSHLVPVLIEAIKELDAKNNAQKTELEKQSKTNEELKASIENLLIRMSAVENNLENKTNKAEK